LKDQILNLILSRRTIHHYLNEEVPVQVIRDAIWAAVHAPNHKWTWPWRFYWLGPAAREKLATVNAKFAANGELLVLAISKSSDATRAREDYAAMACAIQNVSLYLHHLNYGTKWSTGKLMRTEGLLETIGETEGSIEVCGLLWIGRADKAAPAAPMPERPALDHFLKRID
jgi:nitroreductase